MQGRLRHAASYKCCSVSENACAKVSFMLTRSLFTLVLLSACSANPGQAVLSQPASAHATPTDVASDARRAPLDLAREAAKRGVLDVASLYYAQVLKGSPTAEVRIEQLRTLAQAYAPEATKLLQSARSELDASAVRSIERLINATPSEAPPSAESLREAATAFFDKDYARAITILSQSRDPSALVALGRVRRASGDETGARREFARARVAAGERSLNWTPTPVEPPSYSYLAWRGRYLTAVRQAGKHRPRGYTPGDSTTWVEQFEQTEASPWWRVALPANVDAFSMSFDGRHVAVAADKTLRLIDGFSGQRVREWPQPHGVFDLTFSAKGDGVAVATEGAVVEYDLVGKQLARFPVAGKALGTMRVYTGPGAFHQDSTITIKAQPRVVAMSPDATWLAAGVSDGSVRLWNKKSRAARQLLLPKGELRHSPLEGPAPPIALTFTQDSRALLVAYKSGVLARYPVPAGVVSIVSHGVCSQVEFSKAWRFGSKSAASPAQLSDCGTAAHAEWSRDASKVFLGGALSASRVRSSQGEEISAFAALGNHITAFDDTGAHFALAGHGVREHWDVQKGERKALVSANDVTQFLHTLSRDGRYLLVSTARPLAYQSDASRPQLLVHDTRLHTHQSWGEVRVLSLGRGDNVLVQTADGVVELRSLAGGRVRIASLGRKADPESSAPPADFDESQVLLQNGRELVRYSAKDGRRLSGRELTHEYWGIEIVSAQYALLTRESATDLVEIASGRVLKKFEQHAEVTSSVDGRLLAIAENRSIRVMRVPDLQTVATLQLTGAGSRVRAVRFSSNDELLVQSRSLGPLQRWPFRSAAKLIDTDVNVLSLGRVQRVGNTLRVYDRGVMLLDRDYRRTATALATESGSWLAFSAAGAVDGPIDARAATIVEQGDGQPVFDGNAVWDRLEVRNLLEYAAQGKNAAPPHRWRALL